MTPTTPGVGEDTTPSSAGTSIEPFSRSLLPFPKDHLPGLPSPHVVREELVKRLNEAVAEAREARGKVRNPEDVYPLVRSVQGVSELLDEYAAAFKVPTKTARAILEEELHEVIPEQDGIPISGLTVPQAEGDIRIGVDVKTEYFIDMSQVLGALAALVSSEWVAAYTAEQSDLMPGTAPEQFAMEVAERALAFMGASQAKVTHVRALADNLARRGEDQLAGVVRDAIRKNRKYAGIKVTRGDAA